MAESSKKVEGSKKVLFKLSRKFWDGQRAHEAGSEMYFVEGTQPSTAIRVEPR